MAPLVFLDALCALAEDPSFLSARSYPPCMGRCTYFGRAFPLPGPRRPASLRTFGSLYLDLIETLIFPFVLPIYVCVASLCVLKDKPEVISP